jgi:hypothetical protein
MPLNAPPIRDPWQKPTAVQIHVALNDITPPVWRRLIVPLIPCCAELPRQLLCVAISSVLARSISARLCSHAAIAANSLEVGRNSQHGDDGPSKSDVFSFHR